MRCECVQDKQDDRCQKSDAVAHAAMLARISNACKASLRATALGNAVVIYEDELRMTIWEVRRAELRSVSNGGGRNRAQDWLESETEKRS